jgi:hypothetical protein
MPFAAAVAAAAVVLLSLAAVRGKASCMRPSEESGVQLGDAVTHLAPGMRMTSPLMPGPCTPNLLRRNHAPLHHSSRVQLEQSSAARKGLQLQV